MYLVIDLEPTMPPSSRALIFVAWVRHRQVARAAARAPHAQYLPTYGQVRRSTAVHCGHRNLRAVG